MLCTNMQMDSAEDDKCRKSLFMYFELTSPWMLVLQEMKLSYDPDLERGISQLRMYAVISLA